MTAATTIAATTKAFMTAPSLYPGTSPLGCDLAVHPHPVLALAFGRVHRDIGATQQLIAGVGASFRDRGAHRAAGRADRIADEQRLAQKLHDAAADRLQLRSVGSSFEKNCKFVATESRCHVARPCRCLKALRDRDEHAITDG